MNTRHVSELYTDYLDGTLNGASRQAMTAHLAECPRCAAELQALRQVIGQVQALPTVPVPDGFTARVQARVSGLPRPRPAWGIPAFAGGVALAGLIVALVMINAHPGSLQQAKVTPIPTPTPLSLDAAKLSGKPAAKAQHPHPGSMAPPLPRPAMRDAVRSPELADPFIAAPKLTPRDDNSTISRSRAPQPNSRPAPVDDANVDGLSVSTDDVKDRPAPTAAHFDRAGQKQEPIAAADGTPRPLKATGAQLSDAMKTETRGADKLDETAHATGAMKTMTPRSDQSVASGAKPGVGQDAANTTDTGKCSAQAAGGMNGATSMRAMSPMAMRPSEASLPHDSPAAYATPATPVVLTGLAQQRMPFGTLAIATPQMPINQQRELRLQIVSKTALTLTVQSAVPLRHDKQTFTVAAGAGDVSLSVPAKPEGVAYRLVFSDGVANQAVYLVTPGTEKRKERTAMQFPARPMVNLVRYLATEAGVVVLCPANYAETPVSINIANIRPLDALAYVANHEQYVVIQQQDVVSIAPRE